MADGPVRRRGTGHFDWKNRVRSEAYPRVQPDALVSALCWASIDAGAPVSFIVWPHNRVRQGASKHGTATFDPVFVSVDRTLHGATARARKHNRCCPVRNMVRGM